MLHWLLSWFTPDKIIAIATIVYAGVTVVMFFEIRSQAKAARDQAEISRNAADAATRSADALINAERAWVHVQLVGPGRSLTTYTLRTVNYGRTPAEIESYSVGHRCLDTEAAELPEFPGYMVLKNEVHKLLVKDSHDDLYTFDVSQEFAGDRWKEICEGRKTGVLDFLVTYYDVLDRRTQHHTRAVFSCTGPSGTLSRLHQYNKYT